MGQKQIFLETLVYKKYKYFIHEKVSPTEYLFSSIYNEVYNIYKELGGQSEIPKLAYGRWDISTKKFIIELDEEMHFNRYRLVTLQSHIYDGLKYFPLSEYKNHCINYEPNCLKRSHGNYWKTKASDKQFGNSNIEGNFNDGGSSRAKQRAFYDFLKDVSSKIKSIPVIRVSIYDRYEGKSIQELIKNDEGKILFDFIQNQIKNYG